MARPFQGLSWHSPTSQTLVSKWLPVHLKLHCEPQSAQIVHIFKFRFHTNDKVKGEPSEYALVKKLRLVKQQAHCRPNNKAVWTFKKEGHFHLIFHGKCKLLLEKFKGHHGNGHWLGSNCPCCLQALLIRLVNWAQFSALWNTTRKKLKLNNDCASIFLRLRHTTFTTTYSSNRVTEFTSRSKVFFIKSQRLHNIHISQPLLFTPLVGDSKELRRKKIAQSTLSIVDSDQPLPWWLESDWWVRFIIKAKEASQTLEFGKQIPFSLGETTLADRIPKQRSIKSL